MTEPCMSPSWLSAPPPRLSCWRHLAPVAVILLFSGSQLPAREAPASSSLLAPAFLGQTEQPKIPKKEGNALERIKTLGAARKGEAAKTPAATAKEPLASAAPGTAEGEGPTTLQAAVGFIRENARWILGGLGGLLVVVLAWALLASRGRKERGGEPVFAELGLAEKSPRASQGSGSQRYSSTKIQASDVNSRVAKAVKTTEVETDREYALVVDEEALKMPPLPEESNAAAPGRVLEANAIEKLLATNNLTGAYEEYRRQVEAQQAGRFEGDLESRLGDRLLQARELAKATRVLERHVKTHANEGVPAQVYFNLGYAHFLNRSFPESRRYLKLFCKSESNPVYVARARKILQQLQSSTS